MSVGSTPLGTYARPVPRTRIYLCRHAEAAPGTPDELRRLTAAGQARADAMGRELRCSTPPPTAVVTSPLRRAHDTAKAIAEAIGVEPRIAPCLAPGARASHVVAAVASLDCHGAVAVVGHQPDLSHIALALVGHDPGVAPGAIHGVDLPA
jgi:phosphohistidine phosphatase